MLVERQQLNRCDALSWPPLSSGRWSALRYREFVFVGYTELLTLDVLTGSVQVSRCGESAFLLRCHGEALHCTPILTHTLEALDPDSTPVYSLTYLGQVSCTRLGAMRCLPTSSFLPQRQHRILSLSSAASSFWLTAPPHPPVISLPSPMYPCASLAGDASTLRSHFWPI